MPSAKKHVVGKNVDMKILPQLAIRNVKPIPSTYSGAVILCATIFPTTKHFLIVSFWCVFLGHIFGTLSVYTPKKRDPYNLKKSRCWWFIMEFTARRAMATTKVLETCGIYLIKT